MPRLDTGRVRRLQGLLGSAERLDTSGRGLLNFEMRMVISPAAESSSGRSENTRVLTHARLHPSPGWTPQAAAQGGLCSAPGPWVPRCDSELSAAPCWSCGELQPSLPLVLS